MIWSYEIGQRIPCFGQLSIKDNMNVQYQRCSYGKGLFLGTGLGIHTFVQTYVQKVTRQPKFLKLLGYQIL